MFWPNSQLICWYGSFLEDSFKMWFGSTFLLIFEGSFLRQFLPKKSHSWVKIDRIFKFFYQNCLKNVQKLPKKCLEIAQIFNFLRQNCLKNAQKLPRFSSFKSKLPEKCLKIDQIFNFLRQNCLKMDQMFKFWNKIA